MHKLKETVIYYFNNKILKRIRLIFIVFTTLLTIKGLKDFTHSTDKNNERIMLASSYYERWYEQAHSTDSSNESGDMFILLDKTTTTFGIAAGATYDNTLEVIKYGLSDFDISNTGTLNYYLDKRFDEEYPDYLLTDLENKHTLKKIELKIDEQQIVNLYRNGVNLPFTYSPDSRDNLFECNNFNLNELISLGFVKAYVEQNGIAVITDNQITALALGKTKLILLYGREVIEVDVIVTN